MHLRLWNPSPAFPLQWLGVAFFPDGQTLASWSWDDTVYLWQVSNGSLLRVLRGHGHVVECVALSPDGRTLASGLWDGIIRLCQVANGALLGTLEGGGADWVLSIAFSPDGQTLAAGANDGTVRLWQVA